MFTMAPIAIMFGGYYTFVITFTFLLQNFYSVSVFEVGVYLVILGAGTLVGTLSGGPLSDRLAKGKSPAHRLWIVAFCNLIFAALLVAIGWTYTSGKVYPIAFSFFFGFFLCLPTSSATAFEVEYAARSGKQNASAVSGLQFALMYFLAAIGAQLTLQGESSVGLNYYYLIWVGLNFLSFIGVTIVMIVSLIHYRKLHQKKSADLEEQGIAMATKQEPATEQGAKNGEEPKEEQLEQPLTDQAVRIQELPKIEEQSEEKVDASKSKENLESERSKEEAAKEDAEQKQAEEEAEEELELEKLGVNEYGVGA